MSKTKTAPVATKPAAATSSNGSSENRSELIRAYKASNPEATTSQIVEALTKQGHEVSSSLVSSVLSRGSRGSRIDVESIKTAASFLKTFKGGMPEAKKAIETVGGFVESCGSAAEALAALDAYEALAAVVK